ncbi:SRPBCC domain-containing protein [Candidatus Gracilibacteria bacterium]|nr:SRPBCC domain-containing protein [Candidatus Gracilibacteria bacterium]
MKTVRQRYSINAPVEKVWRALVSPKLIDQWGGGPAKMSARVDAKFSLWGGDIYGTNTEVQPEVKLVQQWYAGNWEEPSMVCFSLSEKVTKKGKTTLVVLVHKNIPDEEVQGIRDGWKEYYMEPLKAFVEDQV